MGWKYLVGSTIDSAMHGVLGSKFIPLTPYFPRGVSWMYDAQRFVGRRDFEIIFDVGANIGQTANSLLRYFPGSSIYCFEPVASTFQTLVHAMARKPNVHCVQKALGSREGSQPIAIYADPELNTLVLDGQRKGTGRTEQIDVITIDQFVRTNEIQVIDVLKIDAQGWETQIIKGAIEMIDNIKFIFAEVGFRRSDRDIQHFGDFSELMEQHCFEFCGLYEPYRYGPAKQFYYFANALFINKRHTADCRPIK